MASGVDHVAAELGRQLGPLRRAISRAARTAEDLPDLPDNQIEVLRAVAQEPGLSTTALALRLQLARPTVSNLLNAMRRAGLVELRRRKDDARAVEVFQTALAHDLLARFDKVSTSVIAQSLRELTTADRAALTAALPALANLNGILRKHLNA